MDPSELDAAIWHERAMTFWFSERQPWYQYRMVKQYGEFWDDKFREAEEQDEGLI